jgi:hypothetical protein
MDGTRRESPCTHIRKSKWALIVLSLEEAVDDVSSDSVKMEVEGLIFGESGTPRLEQ